MQTVNLWSLYTATKIEIERARQMARSGRKDDARQIHRFIENSRIIPILKATDFQALPANPPLLEFNHNELGKEVHPDHAPDLSNDLAKIARSLEIIAQAVQKGAKVG